MELTKALTETYLTALEAEDQLFEVVDGHIVEVEPVGEWHGWTGALIHTKMANFILENKLGRMYISDTNFVLDGAPDDIRILRRPDFSFVAAENVTPTMGYIFRAPDLAMEVVSPSQSYSEMMSKVTEYLNHGTQEVWIVMSTGQIQVFYADRTSKIYTDSDIAESRLLKGFKLKLDEVFES
ncbi:MAG: Uma2 family endonuclease [Chloroflexota bacterium]